MIHFDSWDGKNNLSSGIDQANLEAYFGPSAVVFGSYQASISAILEILGARSHIISVIMPITASPDTISGVLRAGAEPFLLDIHPTTLQMDPDALSECLAELEGAVVLLTRPGGQAVDPELLARVGDNPTILDSRLHPAHPSVLAELLVCTFNVFDFSPIIGSGSVVIHKFSEQVRELKMARNGIMGLAANMNDLLAAGALKRLKSEFFHHQWADRVNVAEHYAELLKEKLVIPFSTVPYYWPYFIVRVENADKVIAHLAGAGVEAVKPVFPLHMLSEISRRWVEKPSYPMAESLWRKLVALPCHCGILGKTNEIVERLLEVGTT